MNILINEYHDLPQYGVLYKAARETRQSILPSIQEFLLDHVAGQEKERENTAYHYGSLNLFYEMIIPFEPYELCELVKNIRSIEKFMGSGEKVLTEAEEETKRKLRG